LLFRRNRKFAGKIILKALIQNRKHSFDGLAGSANDVDITEFFKIGAIALASRAFTSSVAVRVAACSPAAHWRADSEPLAGLSPICG